MAITVKEIENLNIKLKKTIESDRKDWCCDLLCDNLNIISSCLESEDTNLAKNIKYISEKYASVLKYINISFSNLSNIMSSYVNATMSNEIRLADNISKVDDDISQINFN